MIRLIPFLLFALLPIVSGAAEWREMLRVQISLQENKTDLSKEFPELSPDMARLGEAFAKTCYAGDEALGRKNFLTLASNLGMKNPKPQDLRQFLNPNKKPWDGYTGATNGNFHMLCNTGTLNLDTSDGSTKDHPAFALCRKSGISGSRMKPVIQALSSLIRERKFDISNSSAGVEFHEAWEKRAGEKGFNQNEIRFGAAVINFTI